MKAKVNKKTDIDFRNDRLGRDIRNSLARVFVDDLAAGNLAASKACAAAWLSKSPSSYHQYIHHRLQAYEEALKLIQTRHLQDAFYRALVLWDHQLFFEVHEILEVAWQVTAGTEKLILQAMIRAAGVYIHLANGNRIGAEKMAARSLAVLTELRAEIPPFAGLDLLLNKLADLDPTPPKIYL